MTYTSPYRFGPGMTSSVIKGLLIATGCISLFAALTNGFFHYIFQSSGPQEWFSLSWGGIQRLYLWQLVSFLFVQSSGAAGITFTYLINLTFMLYFIWILGSIVQERVGDGPFLRLYFISGALAGITALLAMPLFGYTQLAGPAPALLALLAVWTMLHPEADMMLFMLIPVKIKWLAVAILGGILLIALSQLQIIPAIFYLSGALYGYLYGLLAWNLEGPFPAIRPFDHAIASFGIKVRHQFNKWRRKKDSDPRKIVQFPLDDDQFIDAMLAKISRYGEHSLSWSERRRMDEISRKKAQK